MKVKTDFTGSPYITAGRVYDAKPSGKYGFDFRDDTGELRYASLVCSSHIGGRDWIIVNEKPQVAAAGKAQLSDWTIDEKPMTATEVMERQQGHSVLVDDIVEAAATAALADLVKERDSLKAQLDELREWIDLVKRHKGDQYLILNRHNDYPYHEEEFDFRFFTKREVAEALKHICPGYARVVEVGRVLSEKEIVALCEQKVVDS